MTEPLKELQSKILVPDRQQEFRQYVDTLPIGQRPSFDAWNAGYEQRAQIKKFAEARYQYALSEARRVTFQGILLCECPSCSSHCCEILRTVWDRDGNYDALVAIAREQGCE